MTRPWFKTKGFSTMEIEEFKSISNHTIIKSKIIHDVALVESLVERIEQIDPNGDRMVSWGPDAAHMSLTFQKDDVKEVVEIYQQKFKTPSTGFHGRNELESTLYAYIRSLLD